MRDSIECGIIWIIDLQLLIVCYINGGVMMKRRVLSMVLVLSMLLGSMPVSAVEEVETGSTQETMKSGESADSALTVEPMAELTETVSGTWGDLTWTLTPDGTLAINGKGKMANFYSYISDAWRAYKSEIKSICIEDGVTSIGEYAFFGCSNLKSITIPDSVTSIGSDAFCNCESLIGVTIPDSVTSIGGAVFSGCTNLTNVTIGIGMTSISDSAFYNCQNLTSITIPDSVTSIGSYAFSGCENLTSVTIGNGVTSIDSYAFADCNSLTRVYISDLEAWSKITFDGLSANPLYYARNLYLNGGMVTDLVI